MQIDRLINGNIYEINIKLTRQNTYYSNVHERTYMARRNEKLSMHSNNNQNFFLFLRRSSLSPLTHTGLYMHITVD